MKSQLDWNLNVSTDRSSRNVELMSAVLNCRHCGNPTLHANRIDVYNRKEDEETGQHVTISPDTLVAIDRDLTGNPSPRREGMTMTFDCELCDYKTKLHVFQHKGAVSLVSE